MTFREQVYNIVKEIPYGYVTNYGTVALMMGKPRASRQVGFALRALTTAEHEVPWWRVVNKKGYISIDHGHGGAEKSLQKQILEEEGIEIGEDLVIDMVKYGWYGG